MAAYVNPVSLVHDCFRNATDVTGHFEDDRYYAGLVQQLVCSGQARRASADDNGSFLFQGIPISVTKKTTVAMVGAKAPCSV